MPQRVGAIVVTYNRRELLRECLTALQRQTRPLDAILVVDNASTDGTPGIVAAEFPDAQVLRLDANGGSAGGFNAGLRRGLELGLDWMWLMDDDTIPHADALARLLEAHDRFDPARRPALLNSLVVWTDGRPHPHNLPHVRRVPGDVLLTAAGHATLACRNATYVSLLISRTAVELYGFPYPDFFIWNDDVEYTARILRRELGVYVPASMVVHKTKTVTQTVWNSGPGRFYFLIRNRLWMMKMPGTWTGKERLDLLKPLLYDTSHFLKHERCRPAALWALLRAITRGVFTRPRRDPALPPGKR